jgi:anti-sigma regulatory factor (Ser/Thr protein kinase)
MTDEVGPLLVIRHDRAEMGRLSAWLDGRIAALGLGQAPAYAVRLCLEEAVLNVVTHGTLAPGVDGNVRVWLDRKAEGVAAWIEDRGPAFDPLAVADAPAPGNLAEAPLGGLGIRLIRQFASHVAYQREAGMNRLMLQFAG